MKIEISTISKRQNKNFVAFFLFISLKPLTPNCYEKTPTFSDCRLRYFNQQLCTMCTRICRGHLILSSFLCWCHRNWCTTRPDTLWHQTSQLPDHRKVPRGSCDSHLRFLQCSASLWKLLWWTLQVLSDLLWQSWNFLILWSKLNYISTFCCFVVVTTKILLLG